MIHLVRCSLFIIFLGLYDAEVVFLKPRPAFVISLAPVPASNIYR